MTRQLEADRERRQRKLDALTLRACNGALFGAVERSGGELLGFSVRMTEFDVLLTLKAEFPAGRQVCFVGGEDLSGVLRRAVKEGNQDALQWRVDKWAKSDS